MSEDPKIIDSITRVRLRIRGRTYDLPHGVYRLAVGKLIEAEGVLCGADSFDRVRDVTIEQRATEAIAFLARALREDSNEAIDLVIEEEVQRHGGGADGAREVYSNLLTLEEWLGLFYGPLARSFLCAQHQDIADAMDKIADAYATSGSGSQDEGEHGLVSDAIAEALLRTLQGHNPLDRKAH